MTKAELQKALDAARSRENRLQEELNQALCELDDLKSECMDFRFYHQEMKELYDRCKDLIGKVVDIGYMQKTIDSLEERLSWEAQDEERKTLLKENHDLKETIVRLVQRK